MLAVSAAYASKEPVVQKLLRDNTYKVSTGTAFSVRWNGKSYLVTNWHVCRSFSETDAANEASGTTVKAQVLKAVPTEDLCILTSPSFGGLEVGASVVVGADVYTAGYPSGHKNIQVVSGQTTQLVSFWIDFFQFDRSCPAGFRQGISTERGQPVRTCELYMTTMDTTLKGDHGSSGSPVVDGNGKLVGVVNERVVQGDKVLLSYLPVENLIRVLKLLEP